MGFTKVSLIALLAINAAIVAPVMAVQFVVGDKEGWRLNVDYVEWAKRKNFRVGDKLVFRFREGLHNVVMVDSNEYDRCLQPNDTRPLTDGNDAVTLASPGKKWYICSKGNHCRLGMKLAIDVQPLGGTVRRTSSRSSAPRIFAPNYIFLSSMISAAAIFFVFIL